METVVLREPRALDLVDLPMPRLTERDHVRIGVGACGICGSDLRYYVGENPWALHTLGKHIDNPPNIILGHEYAGVVEEVNSKEYEHWLGKRVGVQAFRVCGKCTHCRGGRHNLCKNTIHMGHAQGWGEMPYYPGAYAEHALGWADLLYPLAEHVSFAEAAMADILCVAIHTVGRAQDVRGRTVLCIGCGPAGLGIAEVAHIRGAKKILLVDPSPFARHVAEQYDALVAIDAATLADPDALKDINSGKGFDVIFDTVGSSDTILRYLPLLEEAGHYVNIALHDHEVLLNSLRFSSERTMTSSSNATYADVAEAYRLLNENMLDVKPWISHRFALADFQDAFELLLSSPKQAYKVVFEPQN